jgi:hypothetical protein
MKGETRAVPFRAAIDTFDELVYFRNGGHSALRAARAGPRRGLTSAH